MWERYYNGNIFEKNNLQKNMPYIYIVLLNINGLIISDMISMIFNSIKEKKKDKCTLKNRYVL